MSTLFLAAAVVGFVLIAVAVLLLIAVSSEVE